MNDESVDRPIYLTCTTTLTLAYNIYYIIKLIKANIQPYVRRMHAYGRYGSGESDRRIRNCARALIYNIYTCNKYSKLVFTSALLSYHVSR